MTEEQIIRLYGERCAEHCDDCCVCEVWAMHDLIKTQAREIERLGVIAGGNARLVCKVLDEKDAEIERLNTLLSEMNDTDVIARTMAENERLREALGKAKYWIGDLGPAHVLNKERSSILFAFLRELEAL